MNSYNIFTVMDDPSKTYITKQNLTLRLGHTSDIECSLITTVSNCSISYNQTPDTLISSKLIDELELNVVITPTLPFGEIPSTKAIIEAYKKNLYQVDLFITQQIPNQSLCSGFILFEVLGKDEWLFYWIETAPSKVLDTEIDHWKKGGNDLQTAVKLEYSEELGWTAAYENKPVPKYGSKHLSAPMVFKQSRGAPLFDSMVDVFNHMKQFVLKD